MEEVARADFVGGICFVIDRVELLDRDGSLLRVEQGVTSLLELNLRSAALSVSMPAIIDSISVEGGYRW